MSSIRMFWAARWNGERAPFLRDRCEGCCGEGLHYHILWAGWIGHALLLLCLVIVCIVVAGALL